MIQVPFEPVLLTVGGYGLRWSALLGVGGLVMAAITARRLADRCHTDGAVLLRAASWTIPAGIVSARAAHLLGNWEFYVQRAGEVWAVPSLSGLSLWGGLVVGAAVLWCRLAANPALLHERARACDVAALAAAVGIVVGRVGSFLDGAGQGAPSTAAWATTYLSARALTPDVGIPRHPAQLYDGLAAALAAWVAWAVLRKQLPAGWAACGATATYALGRIAALPVRADPPFMAGLPLDTLLAMLALAMSLVGAARLAMRLPRPRAWAFASHE